MTKRIRAIGNSAGIIIDKPILELLKITPDTELELSTDGERLVITPLRSAADRKAALARAQRRVVRDHDATFRKLARVIEPRFLSVEEVLHLHDDQLALYGGSAGIRDSGALESAVETPRATLDGTFLHPSLFHMAAAYAFHIAESQAFIDGNKRTALNAALVFLLLNGWIVRDPGGLLYDAMISISSRSMTKAELGELLERLATPDSDEDAF